MSADGNSSGTTPRHDAVPIETVRTERFSMRYFRFGHGPGSLVILPGLSVQSVMDSARAVAGAYAEMTGAFTVTVFDRREEVPENYSVRDMAEDTARAMEVLGMSGVCLFGASQGGMIAMLIAAEHPGLVSRLALGSTAASVDADPPGPLREWVRLAEEGDAEGLYLSFGKAVYPEAVFDQIRGTLLEAAGTVTPEELARFVRLARGTAGFDSRDRIGAIRCPVLVLASEDDRVLGPDASVGLARIFGGRPDFSMHTWSGYGHAAYDTAPDYREKLLRFFTE